MREVCLVYFHAGAGDLDAAADAIVGYGMTVSRRGDQLTAGRPGSPQFGVRLVAGEQVQPVIKWAVAITWVVNLVWLLMGWRWR